MQWSPCSFTKVPNLVMPTTWTISRRHRLSLPKETYNKYKSPREAIDTHVSVRMGSPGKAVPEVTCCKGAESCGLEQLVLTGMILVKLLRELPSPHQAAWPISDGLPMKVFQRQLGSNYRSELWVDEQLLDTLSSLGNLTIPMPLGQDPRTLVFTWQLSCSGNRHGRKNTDFRITVGFQQWLSTNQA